ncbi:hypothetical protein ACFX2I_006922 [Malus domestica]
MSRTRRVGPVIKLEPQEGVDPRVLRQKELNRKFVSFSKRRYGLFSKATDFCLKFDAQIAILVLSPAGRPYSFGHSSVDAVLNRYFKIAQIPSTSRAKVEQMPSSSSVKIEELASCSSSGVLTVDDQQQRDRIQELRNQLENQKKRKRENEIAEKEKVAKVKESIEKELQTCKIVEELVAFKQKYSVLLDNINKRLKKSPVNKRQCVSIKPQPKSEDHLWSNSSTLNFETGHHAVVDHEHPHYNNCSFQDVVNRQCVSIKPIVKSENILPPSSTINFEIDHHCHGNKGGGEGSVSQDKFLEDNNAQRISIRPLLISEDTQLNTTLTRVADDHHVSNGNGPFTWNAEDLENFLLRQDLEDIGGAVDQTRYSAMLNYFKGEDGNDPNGAIDVSPAEHVVFPATTAPFDPVGSSDFTQHNTADRAANRYSGYLEDIIHNPYSHQHTRFYFS